MKELQIEFLENYIIVWNNSDQNNQDVMSALSALFISWCKSSGLPIDMSGEELLAELKY